jgi:16S rRNA (cytosine1402-N4)-methyltransferase
VLVDEVAWLLRPRHEGWVIDGTVGMGGHAEAILERSGAEVRLLGLDLDPAALEHAGARLGRFGERVRLRHASFRDLAAVAAAEGVGPVRSILLDLGVSSYQLDTGGRGFSFRADEPLDMRFDPGAPRSAATLLNELPEAELARILFEYGDERHARRIARAIVHRRPLATTGDRARSPSAGSTSRRGRFRRFAWPSTTRSERSARRSSRRRRCSRPAADSASLRFTRAKIAS